MRIVIVGAGIIGLSCAFWLLRDGHAVTVVDRDPAGDKASFGNAGAIAVPEVVPVAGPGLLWQVPRWLVDPLGPLAIRPGHLPPLLPWLRDFLRAGRPAEVARIAGVLAQLNARADQDLAPVLEATGLTGDLHREGALYVYETDAGFRRDAGNWALRRRHGIICEVISGDEAREMAPALGSLVHRAVFTPQWSYVSDPKRIVDELRGFLQRQGVTFRVAEAVALERGATARLRQGDGVVVDADRIVVAAGAWSARLAVTLGDRARLESERGYNATLPASGIALRQEIIFAEKKFVATPLAIGLRIGGAAEFAGLEAPANPRRADALVRAARRYLPGLDDRAAVRWMGHRPSTPDSLPVIGASPRDPRVHYAFGHGHLGLTQASTTGRLVAGLIGGRRPPFDLAPLGIERFR